MEEKFQKPMSQKKEQRLMGINSSRAKIPYVGSIQKERKSSWRNPVLEKGWGFKGRNPPSPKMNMGSVFRCSLYRNKEVAILVRQVKGE